MTSVCTLLSDANLMYLSNHFSLRLYFKQSFSVPGLLEVSSLDSLLKNSSRNQKFGDCFANIPIASWRSHH